MRAGAADARATRERATPTRGTDTCIADAVRAQAHANNKKTTLNICLHDRLFNV
jgi:hypothetical protein